VGRTRRWRPTRRERAAHRRAVRLSHPEAKIKRNPCSLDKSDVVALEDAFRALGSAQRAQAIRDLFALGCYIHLAGGEKGRDAGSKACLTAMDALHPSKPGLASKILNNLTGNEKWLAEFFGGHREIIELFFVATRQGGAANQVQRRT